ncbi:MAG: asparagine synthase (glutamine-hydrolyzing) [Firmicutes bacterium]|nr:asparagine synthase (glutamine-hydrolyzing) [Bacillota bacterium]
MCGITGWIDWKGDLTGAGPVLRLMVETLAPRGPDDEGMWLSPHAALGHRRLSVIDPAGGAQPMVRERGSSPFVIVYNGELYNTEDIRRELLTMGYNFRGHSDTEVLLTAYIEWGPTCVHRLNGIFAFAVWNDGDRTLFVARDRLGVKPLFYTQRNGSFFFGSELKALLAHPHIPPEIDEEGLAEVFIMGPARTPGHGVFRGVAELKPGHMLLAGERGTRVEQYWSLQSRLHEDDPDTTAGTVRWLLQDTVERQLVSDVPICTLLSGGLDSSAVTAFAAQAFKRQGLEPLHTYSIDYVDNDRYFRANRYQPDADGPWAERVSGFLGTVHQRVLVDTPELVKALKAAVRARDLPGMADVDSSLLLFSSEIKKGATVGLSGESADEVFGGYPWFRDPEALSSGGFPWSLMTGQRARLLSPELQRRVRAEEYAADRFQEALAEVPALPDEEPEDARMRKMFYLNITRFLPTLLDRKDRMSMAAGLELRVPFCDHRIVEYVWNIPWKVKFAGQREKGILRQALAEVLPEDVLARRKSPYPKTHNPAYLTAARDWLSRILDDPSSPILPLLDVEFVRGLIPSDGRAFGPAWFGQLMGGAQLFAYLGQIDTWLGEHKVQIR